MKVIIGPGVGGLRLSDTAVKLYAERVGWPKLFKYTSAMGNDDFHNGRTDVPVPGWYNADVSVFSCEWIDHILDYSFFASRMKTLTPNPKIYRTDPILIGIALELGDKFVVSTSTYSVVHVQANSEWVISERDDGSEYISTKWA